MKMFLGALGLVCLAAIAYWVTRQASNQAEDQTKTFHAVLYVAHIPEHIRQANLAKEFARRLEEHSKGRLKIEVKFPSDTSDSNHFRDAVKMVRDNEAQISKIGTTHLATLDSQFQVFDMPFLFQSHEHAFQVLDGEIGKKLNEHLLQASKNTVRPLAYSYGGGYRVFISNKLITKTSQLEGLKMHFYGPSADPSESISQNPTLARLHTVLAYKMVPVMNESHPEYASGLDFFKNGKVDISEDHYSNLTRLFQKFGPVKNKMKFLWETDHSLFLTSIVVNEKFFESLPKDLQNILQEESQRMAVEDRKDVIKVNQDAKESLIKSGYTVTPLSAAEKQTMMKASRVVYEKLGPQIGVDIIQSIESLAKSPSDTSAVGH